MPPARPQILYLTRHLPHGRSYGGQLRTLHLCRLLQQCGDLGIVVLTMEDIDESALAKTKAEFDVKALLRLNLRSVQGLRARLGHELDPRFLTTHGFCLGESDRTRIERLISEYDMVWVHNFSCANCASIRNYPKSVLDIDDVLSRFYRSGMTSAGSWMERLRSVRQWWLWKRREAVLFERFNLLAVCSEADRQYLGAGNRIHTIPNGFEPPNGEPERAPAIPPRIGFIGTLNYAPNREAVDWFIRQVWPRIKLASPDARLRLAGTGTETGPSQLGSDIDGLGWIEDASSEMATWAMMVVPIRVGGGTRIKIVEGFSRKCPVVSTTLGAYGREVTSGEELLLADTPAEFAQACLSLLQQPGLGKELAERAWKKFLAHWTWSAMKPKVEATVERSLSLSQRPALRAIPRSKLRTPSLRT